MRDDIVGIGTDGALWHAYNDDAGNWHWESLGGALTSAPGAAWHKDGTLSVYARGKDNQVWQISWAPVSGWGGWKLVGGLLTSGPAVTTPIDADVDAPAVAVDISGLAPKEHSHTVSGTVVGTAK